MAHLTPLVAHGTQTPSARVSGSMRRGVWTQTEAHRESYGGTPFAPFTPMVDSGNALQSEPGAATIASELTILRGAGVKAVQSEPIDAGDSTEASTKHGRGLQATAPPPLPPPSAPNPLMPGWHAGSDGSRRFPTSWPLAEPATGFGPASCILHGPTGCVRPPTVAKRDVPASLPFRPPDCTAETARPHGCVRLPTARGEMSAPEMAPTQPEIMTAPEDLPGGSRSRKRSPSET